MKLTDLLNEEKYTIIDPKGNPAGTGTKDQANQRQKKLGGSKKGYFVVPAKSALKARRTLEKYKFDFKSTKLQDLMSDLYFESVNEAKNDEKYVVIAFHEKGGGFVMTKPGSKKDAEDSARSITKSSDITQQKAVKVSDARKIRNLIGKEYLNESVNEARKLKIGKEDFSYLLKLSDKELVKKLNSIRKDQQKNGKQYMDAFRKKEDTSEIEKEGQRLATLEKAVIAARDMINFESVNEGYSTEEKRIVMMAVRKLAKYRNVPIDQSINDLLGAGQELERDIKRGKIK